MDPATSDLADLAEGGLVADTPLRWGLRHRSEVITLPDGRHVVIRRFAGPDPAGELQRTIAMERRLREAGLPTPAVHATGKLDDGPVLLESFVDATPGSDWLDTPERARTLARSAGAAAGDIRALPLDPVADRPVPFDAVWRWVDVVRESLAPATRVQLAAAVDRYATLHAMSAPAVVHGDLRPSNVLLDTDGDLAAILGLGAWRIGHPLLDVAWWGWSVRHASPEVAEATWPVFLSAAGVADSPETRIAIRTLEIAALLERSATDPDPRWLGRLSAALGGA